MTNEQLQVKNWMKAYGQETPDKPCIPSLEVRKLRAKLILEEALETVGALGFQVLISIPTVNIPLVFDSSLHPDVVSRFNPNLEDILDGCEDLKVVTEGTLIACGLTNPEQGYDNAGCWKGEDPHFNEVMRSNWSKMWTTNELRKHRNWPDDLEGCSTAVSEGEFIAQRVGPINSMDDRVWCVKDKDGKVIKSPSYSPPNFQLE